MNQHAFVGKKSTATKLLECINDWTTAIDKNIPIDVLYLDIAKAFDSVPLEKLMLKLEKVGIGGSVFAWMKSFMCDRLHCVRVNGVKSSFEPVLSGIAQGSIMGPILFILYVNGVFELHLTINIKLFADDAKLYRPIATPMDLTTMQDDINKI